MNKNEFIMSMEDEKNRLTSSKKSNDLQISLYLEERL